MSSPRLRSLFWVATLLVAAWVMRAPTLGRHEWNLDEACTFTMAQQIRNGGVLYRDAVDHRGPLVPYLKAAVFAIAGDWNVHAVRLAVALMIGLAALLLRSIARNLGDAATGNVSSIVFLILSVTLAGTNDSFAAHTEWFVVFFSALGFWLFTVARQRGDFGVGLAIGAMFAASALCKQPGLLDLGVVWVLLNLLAWWDQPERNRFLRLGLGTLVGVLAVGCVAAAFFWQYGTLHDFVYYAWRYNVDVYVPEIDRWHRLAAARVPFLLLAKNTPALGLLAAIGAVGLLAAITRGPGKEKTDLIKWLILGWCAAGLISTTLSGREFEHYCIQLMPGLSLAAGWCVAQTANWIRDSLSRRRAMALLASGALTVAAAVTTQNLRQAYRNLPDHELEGWNELGDLVRRYSAPRDRIFVWGYYPDGYLLSQRLPSTRFINANFLSGMVPWTNLEYSLDTRYAIVPGAWETFWADYRQHPPTVVLEAVTRGYVKYPILARANLRDEIIEHFVQVESSKSDPFHVRVFRRLDSGHSRPTGAVATDHEIQLYARQLDGLPDLVEVRVVAPRSAEKLQLRLGSKSVRQLSLSANAPVEATFFIRISELTAPESAIADAVLLNGTQAFQSSPINLVTSQWLAPEPITAIPCLAYGTDKIISTTTTSGPWSLEPRNGLLGWSINQPFVLEFPRPAKMEKFTWRWQPPPRRGVTPGVTSAEIPEVTLVTKDRAALPLTSTQRERDGAQIIVTTELPPGASGQVQFRWNGPDTTSRANPEVWLGALSGFSAGPGLRHRGNEILPVESSALGGKSWAAGPDGRWIGPAPSRVVYPRVPYLNSFDVTFGVDDGIYTHPPTGVGEGVIAEVNFLHPDGRSENLLSEAIRPQLEPQTKGHHRARISLPENAPGRIEIKFNPLPANNPLGADGYLLPLRAQGPGPDLTISSERVLTPIEGFARNTEPIHTFANGRWIAHAPGHVVYSCPADLRAVTFGFGLEEGSYHNDDGSMRTNGVDVVVAFRDETGRSVELYRRRLDPYHNNGDRGVQHGHIELPGKKGTLVFNFAPGPENDSAYDWSYWTDFTGDVDRRP